MVCCDQQVLFLELKMIILVLKLKQIKKIYIKFKMYSIDTTLLSTEQLDVELISMNKFIEKIYVSAKIVAKDKVIEYMVDGLEFNNKIIHLIDEKCGDVPIYKAVWTYSCINKKLVLQMFINHSDELIFTYRYKEGVIFRNLSEIYITNVPNFKLLRTATKHLLSSTNIVSLEWYTKMHTVMNQILYASNESLRDCSILYFFKNQEI